MDLSGYRLTGTNNPAKQASLDWGNAVVRGVEGFQHFTTAEYLAFTGRALTTDQAHDPGEKVIVATGTGAFVRPYWESPITDFMFGAEIGADNADALEAWATFVWSVPCAHAVAASNGITDRSVLLGLSSGALSATKNYTFGFVLKASAAMDHVVQIKGISNAHLQFNCEVWGANSASLNVALASRLAKTGIVYHDLHRCQCLGTIYANNFYYHGTAVDPASGASTTGTRLPYVRAFNIGSSPAADAQNQLECTWSNVVRAGSTGSASQTWTCTVDVAPEDDPLGYPRYLKIADYYYKITDITGTTVTFEAPWLDDISTTAATGTDSYVFGAVHAHGGGDNSTTRLSGVDGHRNGIGLLDESWYGATCDFIHHGSESEVTATWGLDFDSSQFGGKIVAGYTESPPVFIACGDGVRDRYIGAFGGDAFDFTKFYKLGPRLTANGNLKFQAMHGLTVEGHEGKLIMAEEGHTFTTTWNPGSIAAGASTSTTMTISSPIVGTDLSRNVRASFNKSLKGCQLSASITAQSGSNDTCTVTITLNNPPSNATNPADVDEGTLSATLLK